MPSAAVQDAQATLSNGPRRELWDVLQSSHTHQLLPTLATNATPKHTAFETEFSDFHVMDAGRAFWMCGKMLQKPSVTRPQDNSGLLWHRPFSKMLRSYLGALAEVTAADGGPIGFQISCSSNRLTCINQLHFQYTARFVVHTLLNHAFHPPFACDNSKG